MLVPQTLDRPSSLRFPSYFSQNLSILHICFFASFRPCQAILFYSQLATKIRSLFSMLYRNWAKCPNVYNWMCVVPWRVIPKFPPGNCFTEVMHTSGKSWAKKLARGSFPSRFFSLVLYTFFFALTRRISHKNFASHLRKGLTKLPCEAIAQLFPHVCGGLQKTCPATGIAGC